MMKNLTVIKLLNFTDNKRPHATDTISGNEVNTLQKWLTTQTHTFNPLCILKVYNKYVYFLLTGFNFSR